MSSLHLEKVLRHAEKQLESESFRKPRDVLEIYRKFLKIEEHRLKLNHQQGSGGRETCQRRSDLMTVVLRHVWRGAMENAKRAHLQAIPPVAMLAVGGFGRGEMNPFSDVDLLFLHGKQNAEEAVLVKAVVEEVLYMLWDVGFDVGHATRSEEDVVEQAQKDLQTKTAMLEARLLCGDEKLWKSFERAFERKCLNGEEDKYVEWRLEDQRLRHEKHEGTPFVQEPNVKGGCGGLRDYHSLIWIAKVKRKLHTTQDLVEAKYITVGERKQMEQAYDFLMRLRSEMHFQQKRKGDILTLQLQGKIANRFGYTHRTILRRIEALMRDYYQHAQVLFQITNTLAERLAGVKSMKARPKWGFLPRMAIKTKELDGFLIQRGIIEASDSSIFTEDPLRALRAFVHAQNLHLEIGPELRFKLRRRIKLLDRTFIYHKSTREMVLGIFSKKGQVGRIARAMHELGFLGRLFPEFEPLTCLVQHEFFHRYTADEHTLVCLEMLDRILDSTELPFTRYKPVFLQIDRPDLLYLALLLHDTGKSEGGRHHSEQSAYNAMKVARRFRLKADDLSILIFLTDHHLTMSDTARTKNLDDEETILVFARIVQTLERLDLLLLLTFADGKGTGGDEKWLEWREMLLWRLYHLTRQALAGEEEFVMAAQKSLAELKKRIRESLAKEITIEEVEAHFVNLPPRYFNSLPEHVIAQHLQLVHVFLARLAEPDRALFPVVGWMDFPDQAHSVVSVVTWDREKVFTKITGAFAACGISILSADISTRLDNLVIDTFRVTTNLLQAVTDPRDQKDVREMLDKVFGDPNFQIASKMPQRKSMIHLGVEGLDFPTKITFDQQSSHEATLLHVTTPDRPGLLFQMANCLAEQEVDVVFARITTEKGAALDTFYITDSDGQKILDDARILKITNALRKSIDA